MGRLENKIAIVTGGAQGIGRAIAQLFCEEGASVLIGDINVDEAKETANDITDKTGKKCIALKVDISRKEDIDRMVSLTIKEFSRIDILVNNAGIIVRASLLEHSEEDWDAVLDTNLKGYYLCSQAVGKGMVERRKGSIINVASTAGFRVGPTNSTIYSIAKAGVIMLARGLAWELGSHNVRVNTIAPGTVRVERGRSQWSDPERLKQEEARMPLGRLGEPGDIGSVAVFLASDASRHITGSTIVVDGGLLA